MHGPDSSATNLRSTSGKMDTEELVENFEFLGDWEERYRYIIDLGKQLKPLEDSERIEDNIVRGCQSQVWLVRDHDVDAKLQFRADSDAFIVRGLLAVVLTAFDDKSPTDILAFDAKDFFARLGLDQHLSPSRANGLHSIVEKIRTIAHTNRMA